MHKILDKPISSRKPVKFLFVMGVILIAVYFLLFQFGYSTVFYNYDTGKMDSVCGFAAIEQRKEGAGIFDGKLTQDTLTLIQQKITEAETATIGWDENTVFSARYIYRDQVAILEYMTAPNGKIKSIKEAYPKHESITLGYCNGWDKLLSGMGSVLSILICLLIVISLSPVFAEEYTCHTDSVIYAARYGRTKLVTSKLYLIFLLLNAALYIGVYGVQGWNVNIQSSLHYASSTYNLTFLQMFFISVVLNTLGIAAMKAITLFISAEMNTPVAALIISCTICFFSCLIRFYRKCTDFAKTTRNLPDFYASHKRSVFRQKNVYGDSTANHYDAV